MRDLAELNTQLFEQLDYIGTSSKEFDSGKRHEAKRIANAIYTIVFDKNRTVSILTQLGVKSEVRFLASGKKYVPPKDPQKFRFQSPPLVFIGAGMEFIPRLDSSPQDHRMLGFDEWWADDEIYWFQVQGEDEFEEKTMSRKDLILSLTDQDGGRHLDQILSDANYRNIKNHHDFTDAQTGLLVPKHTELVTARQIGWELVESLRRFEHSKGTKISDPRLYAEIRNNKLRFFPSKSGFYNSPKLEGKLETGKSYKVTVLVEHLTKGTIRLVCNGAKSDPISASGSHSVSIVAGPTKMTGVFGEFTDAIVDTVSFDLA